MVLNDASGAEQQETWRTLLGQLTAERADRQCISELSGLSLLTLQRWIKGESDPRPVSLQALLAVLPSHREALLKLIRVEYPTFTYSAGAEAAVHESAARSIPARSIPSAFIERVLYAYATTPPGLLFWSICSLTLQQALIQLDPDQLGMQITVTKCMPPVRGGKVRCLWELVAVGTPPWRGDLATTTLFLGAESLAGYAVASCSPAIIQRLRENPASLPARKVQHSESAVSYPLLRAGSIAGSMTVTSVEQDYFTAPRLSLIESYARLLALAFQNEELYARESIELGVMPPDEVQRAHLSAFRQRVNALLIEDAGRDEALSMAQAEQRVREQIIEELLQLAL
jgi:GAF domain-containing protein